MLSRRTFLSACSFGIAMVAVRAREALAESHGAGLAPSTSHRLMHDVPPVGERARARSAQKSPHPKPRVGITGAKVMTAAQLADHPQLVSLFDSVRRIPHIIDGIRCNCGCPHPPQMYSLLSCYEGDAMALDCVVCQGQGRLAARLHSEGKTLADMRLAVDAKFA